MDEQEALLINQIFGDLIEAEENVLAPARQLYQAVDPFVTMTDQQFIGLFRANKVVTREIINMLTPYLEQGQTYSSLEIQTKVLVALIFYAHGSYQKITGRNLFSAISQSSVSRCINEVTLALNNNNIANQWIRFPQNIEELQDLRTRFYRQHGLPGVIGCIDCTHVAIVAPNENEHIYVNRKNYHSLNVQLICDEKLKIINMVERFPGSTHDAYIWRQSNMSQIMERIYRENNENLFFLLGDSGYPLRPWLLTPLRHTEPGTPQDRFNNHLKSIRSIIERCNGVLKNRWRCLLKHRVLHYSPETAARITKACCVLHNICITRNIPEPQIDDDEEDYGVYIIQENEAVHDIANNADLLVAREIQQQLAVNYYNQ